MDITVYAVPAVLALFTKGIIYLYSRTSGVYNLQTRLYLFFLFALSIQNLAEIAAFSAHTHGYLSPPYGKLYFFASVVSTALLLHLALILSINRRELPRKFIFIIYAPAVLLIGLLGFTSMVVAGFEPMKYTYTKVPGPLYFFFEIYSIGYLCTVIGLLFFGSNYRWHSQAVRLKSKLMLLGILPSILVVLVVITFQHFLNLHFFNTTITLPIAVTFFLVVTVYAIHQYRLFDIQFYIPWSRVRKRKTAFYNRIRALIAEIADLNSAGEAIQRLAMTLGCPVALVGGDKPALAAAGGANNLVHMPRDALQRVDSILVANEIEYSLPDVHQAMQRHGVAAIVPFYPHSKHASGWLLLGENFSEQVYTKRDFEVVEELFAKMADLFLDKLITMRTQLAEALRELRNFERKHNELSAGISSLENENHTLRKQVELLVNERPVDSAPLNNLASQQLIEISEPAATTITLLGRDKVLFKTLRGYFPQLSHYVSVNSQSFKRQTLPQVLICHLESEAAADFQALHEMLTNNTGKISVLLLGPGAEEFLATYAKTLLGGLLEVLPPNFSPEALVGRVQSLARLRQSVYDLDCNEQPLIGRSSVFSSHMANAKNLARLMEPVLVQTPSVEESIALATYLHRFGRRNGKFHLLRPAEFTLDHLLFSFNGGKDETVMIANLDRLPLASLNHLIEVLRGIHGVRLIAGCENTKCPAAVAFQEAFYPLHIEVPNLCDRKSDIYPLVHYFTLQFNLQADTYLFLTQAEVDEVLVSHAPADTAQLKQTVFEMLKSKRFQQLPDSSALPMGFADEKTLDQYLAEHEACIIRETLERCDGNKSKAARLLGLRPNTLHYKLERYGIMEKT